MKKLLLAVCLMFGGATLVSAQDQPTPGQAQTQDQEGQEISVSELPESVTAKLEGQDYSGWTVGTAHKKMDESNQEMYVVELRQGTETKKVKFDRDGNEIDKKDKSQNYRDDAATPAPDETATPDPSVTPDPSAAPDQSTSPDQSATPDQSTTPEQSTTPQTEQ